jgi:hypothetical protein
MADVRKRFDLSNLPMITANAACETGAGCSSRSNAIGATKQKSEKRSQS